MSDIGKGNQSSEFTALKWLGIGGSLLVGIITTLTAMEVIPQEGLWATVVAVLLAIGKALGDYSKGRSMVKASAEDAKRPLDSAG